ncbi:hypothetical protein BP6252_08989 [Coleophoma cylindrospora]|uniref:Uncharacterized protein n=1 Tax=Coleophoma cylindrospora TaxID=1849047 RepID=A0A3D8R0M0_9HELO|nr:hypothetical protein BP6252_08989 [Coleophoma cylindrospora]
MWALTLDGALGLCPKNCEDAKVKRVLDVGTGTGIWAMEFGSMPVNVQFQVDDLEEPWIFNQKFDYIHCRDLIGGFGDWPKFFAQSYENLEPGGYVEVQSFTFPCQSDDGTLLPDHALMQWSDFMMEAAKALGRCLDIPTVFQALAGEAGFTNIEAKKFKWAMNSWPKDKKDKLLGAWELENATTGLEGLCMALFTRGLGWTKLEVDVFLDRVRADMRNRSIHAYWPM